MPGISDIMSFIGQQGSTVIEKLGGAAASAATAAASGTLSKHTGIESKTIKQLLESINFLQAVYEASHTDDAKQHILKKLEKLELDGPTSGDLSHQALIHTLIIVKNLSLKPQDMSFAQFKMLLLCIFAAEYNQGLDVQDFAIGIKASLAKAAFAASTTEAETSTEEMQPFNIVSAFSEKYPHIFCSADDVALKTGTKEIVDFVKTYDSYQQLKETDYPNLYSFVSKRMDTTDPLQKQLKQLLTSSKRELTLKDRGLQCLVALLSKRFSKPLKTDTVSALNASTILENTQTNGAALAKSIGMLVLAAFASFFLIVSALCSITLYFATGISAIQAIGAFITMTASAVAAWYYTVSAFSTQITQRTLDLASFKNLKTPAETATSLAKGALEGAAPLSARSLKRETLPSTKPRRFYERLKQTLKYIPRLSCTSLLKTA